MMLAKSGQQPSSHLEAIVNEETKVVKSANWNFIWYIYIYVGYALTSLECNLIKEFEI